jgi:hypothetical protein
MTDDAIVADGIGGGPALQVTVPLAPAYASQLVNISPAQVSVSIPLVPGSRVVTTPLQNVGTLTYFQNPDLQASLTIWYNYDPVGNTLTFCSNDLVSSDSTYLTTVPAGTNQRCNQHTYLSDTAPCGSNPNWTYCTPLTPGLLQAIQQTVRTANQTVINAARAQGYTVIVRTPPPQLSAEEYAKLCIVYHKGQFKELYDPTKSYDDDHTLLHLDSVWYGEIYLNGSDYFANVIGSTGDPRISGQSWLGLWQNQFGPAAACTSLNFNGFSCGTYLVGGHVVLGQSAQSVPVGSNNVFIVPICAGHNSNDNVYMAPLTYQKGIAIHNYQH